MALIAVLAINWILVLAIGPAGTPRTKVPFSPYFLQQLNDNHVKSISSKNKTIEGTWTVALKYPANDSKAKAQRCSPPRSRRFGTPPR